MIHAGIIGIGKALPEKVFKNDDFVKMGLDTTDEWIRERTGIIERRIADENTSTSDLAYEACQKALVNSGKKATDMDLIIVATTTPDHIAFPSTACLLQDRLGMRKVGAFDLAAACTGFNYALTTGVQFIKSGFAKNILIVGADCLSKIIDWKDRGTCILFGDGAGAVVLGEVREGFGVLSSDLHADGAQAPYLNIKAGGSRHKLTKDGLDRGENCVYMDGKAVFKLAINVVVPTVKKALQKIGLETKDLNYFIPHQANLRIIEHAREKLGLREDQVFVNIQKYGNTSAASIPIALEEAVSSGKIKEGHIVALVGFGAGFTWGANLVRWGR